MSIKKIIKSTITFIFLIPLIYLSFINFKLYHKPNIKISSGFSYDSEQVKHLRFIKSKINKGAALDMQEIYPEGFVFTYALYGMAWAEFAEKIDDKNDPLFNEAFQEVNRAISEIHSSNGTKVFPKEQDLTYGAYYSGWSNYLLGKKILLDEATNEIDSNKFKNKCDEIALVINSKNSPYIESYRGSAWPADITVAVASLSLHDKIFKPKYKSEISLWVQNVKDRLDPKFHLIPHKDYIDKKHLIPRGSSMSLMLCFLPEIDPNFSKEQFRKYKEGFLTYRFGLPGIREHHIENTNTGSDIDSGPVILSIGGSASIVGQKAFALHGEKNITKGLRNSIEGFGLGWEGFNEKNYLFGQLPILDVFIAWVNGTEIENLTQKESRWRWKFQFISILIYFIFFYSIHLLWRKKKS